jgi:DNA-binding MurR/RpiR family transcriptional regulator
MFETVDTLVFQGVRMTTLQSLEERVAEHYSGLSNQLRKAADYVVANPLDIASRSLRSISVDSGVSPATFSRLSRSLGYDSFETMKDVSRQSVGRSVMSMSERAEQLRRRSKSGVSMLDRQSAACIQNIEEFSSRVDQTKLEQAATRLRCADEVVLLGALASTGITEYMAYLAQFFAPNWSVAGRMGASIASQIAKLHSGCAVLIVTKSPYARRAVIAAKLARDAGADVILVTDHYECPGLAYATYGFVVPTDSPQFFSSYVVTLVLIETLIAMIVAASEADATAEIQRVEAKNQELGEYWTG